MPAGGARARSGPPPDPNALRRDRPSDAEQWTTLPQSGREGEPPDFPLDRPSRREMDLWAREWKRPQAVMWERLGLELAVAMFVRDVATAEDPKASPPARALVIRHMDALGISVAGLRSHRWRIGEPEQQGMQTADDTRRRAPAKSRFKTIAGGRTA